MGDYVFIKPLEGLKKQSLSCAFGNDSYNNGGLVTMGAWTPEATLDTLPSAFGATATNPAHLGGGERTPDAGIQ